MLLEELGRGSYGRVYLCERRVGDGVDTPWRRFAMKIMSKPRLRRQSEYVNVPSGGMRKVTAEDKVRLVWLCGSWLMVNTRVAEDDRCRPHIPLEMFHCIYTKRDTRSQCSRTPSRPDLRFVSAITRFFINAWCICVECCSLLS